MTLFKLQDFIPDYQQYFDNKDILHFDLYSGVEKIGAVENLLLDAHGEFRYFVINTGFWIFGKKVLLPVGYTRIDYVYNRVYADSLSKEQVEELPEYKDEITVDIDHEERIRKIYRTRNSQTPAGFGVGYGGADLAPSTPNTAPKVDLSAGYDGYEKKTFDYSLDPDLYQITEENHGRLLSYQERIRQRRSL